MPKASESFTIKLPANIARRVKFAAEEENYSTEACIAVGAMMRAYTTIDGGFAMDADAPEIKAVVSMNPKRRRAG